MNQIKLNQMKNNSMSAVAADRPVESEEINSIMKKITNILTLKFLKKTKKIVVLRLDGVIGNMGPGSSKGLTLESLNAQIEQAFLKSKATAVILSVNSPGGSPVQSELIAARILQLSKEKNIPVYSFIEDVGASGGYWLACAGSEIYASKSSIVGSIGVVRRGFGFVDAINKLGIERRVQTAGKNKSVLDPFKPEKKEDLELIKNLQLDIHAHFIDYVKTQRSGRITQDDDFLFNGKFWTGERAKEFGLIDGIENLYDFVKNKWGKNAKIEYVAPKESWFKKKFGISHQSDFASNLSSAIKEEIKYLSEEIELSSKYNIK